MTTKRTRRPYGDGGLYELKGRGLWRATIDLGVDPETGKRSRWEATARTKTAARAKRDAALADIARYGRPLTRRVTVEQWSRQWLDMARRDLDPKTRATYASLLRRHVVPTIGHLRVAAVKPSDVARVRAGIVERGLSTATARQAHVVMKRMFEAARVDRLCASNPVDDAPMPSARRSRAVVAGKRGAFSTEQSLAILRAASALPVAVGSRWWFKLLTGARQGEVLGASLADLDLERGLYVVNWKLEELSRRHGCGDPPTCRFKRAAYCPAAAWDVPDDFEMVPTVGRWHLTRPKSKTGRVVPLVPQLVEALRRHVDTLEGPNPHGLVWPGPEGGPVEPRDDSQAWRELLVAAGIISAEEAVPGGTRMTGHWARHTAVTVLMAATNGDAQLVGDIVGHSSAEVTEMYRHARVEERAAAVAALGSAWGAALGQLGS